MSRSPSTLAHACWLVVPLAFSIACGKDPVAPEDRLELRGESAHFAYMAASGDEPVDTAYQERHLAWASGKLGMVPRQQLVYHKYRDRAHLQRVTGHDPTNGFAEPGTYRFHSIWPADNHEYIHALFTSEVGDSPPLFNEGVAVAHHGASLHGTLDGDPLWNGASVHGIAAQHARAGTLPDVARLAYWRTFYDYGDQLTYPVAGSFVAFLIDEEGIEDFKAFVRAGEGSGQALDRTRELFLATYGVSLESARDRWLEFLEARP
jgi:hypothetical protein